MQRCIELALRGAGHVAPNPMVGAVLVHGNNIIGEGYHRHYGEAHAEVNCIASVSEANRSLIGQSTLYVSLEPCAHHGKTPPCADLIIAQQIPKVVIGCRDPFEAVNGRGIEKLKAAGIEVEVGVEEADCLRLNRRFFCFIKEKRPYVILKWAQSADGKIGTGTERRIISGSGSQRLVHKWRSEEAAIMVGTRTAMLDDPQLTSRLWPGRNPVRVVIDRDLRLPSTAKLFDGEAQTIIFNTKKEAQQHNLRYCRFDDTKPFLPQLMVALHSLSIQSLMVEGGAVLLQSLIDAKYWDEARIITNEQLHVGDGLPSPVLSAERMIDEYKVGTDDLRFFERVK